MSAGGRRLAVATARGGGVTACCDRANDEWMLDVSDIHYVGDQGSGRGVFEAGPAHALAIVRVDQQGRNRIATENWNETVHLS